MVTLYDAIRELDQAVLHALGEVIPDPVVACIFYQIFGLSDVSLLDNLYEIYKWLDSLPLKARITLKKPVDNLIKAMCSADMSKI